MSLPIVLTSTHYGFTEHTPSAVSCSWYTDRTVHTVVATAPATTISVGEFTDVPSFKRLPAVRARRRLGWRRHVFASGTELAFRG